MQQPGSRRHCGVHGFPALAHVCRGSSIAHHGAERQIIVKVVANIKGLKLIVRTIRFRQQNHLGIDLVQLLPGIDPKRLWDATPDIAAKSVNREVAGPVNEAVDQIFAHRRLAVVRQRLRPEASGDLSILRLYKEIRIRPHHHIVGRGVIVDDVQHHLEVQLVGGSHKIAKVLFGAALRVNRVIVRDAVWRCLRICGSLRNRSQIDDGRAQVRDLLQPGNRAAQISFRAECVQPQFVNAGALKP